MANRWRLICPPPAGADVATAAMVKRHAGICPAAGTIHSMDAPQKGSSDSSGAGSDEQWLAEFLRDRDTPCPACTYNLRGLTSGRCPECGQALRLAVNLAEPYLKAWVTLLAAACACGGMGLFFALAILRAGGPPRSERALWAAILIQIAMIPAAPIVIRMRRRIMRLDRSRQWQLAGLGIAVLLISMVLVLGGIH
jgi:hypothetical protein